VGVHRLIPERFVHGKVATNTLGLSDETKVKLLLLSWATSGSHSSETGITIEELVFGFPNAHIVNSAFLFCGKDGARFNMHPRGAWYAAPERETAEQEVAFHALQALRDTHEREPQQFVYVDFTANFDADFHHLDKGDEANYRKSDPVPACYRQSQLFAHKLLHEGSNGIVYRSVRHEGAMCIACFRPALVYKPREAAQVTIEVENYEASLTG
jgi:hypothetical protein